jgi:hypothetical protein
MRQAIRLGLIGAVLAAGLGCTVKQRDDDPNGPTGSGGAVAAPGSGGAVAMTGGSGGNTTMMMMTGTGSGGMPAGSGGTGSGGTAPTGSGGAMAEPDAGMMGFIDAGPAKELGALPDDPGERGPWPVGVKTVHVDIGGGNTMVVEVWYPAQPGSEVGQTAVRYDLRQWLPHGSSGDQAVPDEAATYAECKCYRDLPPDVAHAPYPASITVHGTAAFRVTSLAQMDHWASRGFVVLAADHPGMQLSDALATVNCSGTGIAQDTLHTRDVPAMVNALASPAGELAFLQDIVEGDNISVAGHSQGGDYAAAASGLAGVKLVMIWDMNDSIAASANLKGALFVSGMSDKIISYTSTQTAYATTGVKPKRIFGIKGTGHLGVTSLCGGRNSAGEDALQVANHYGVCQSTFALADILWDCSGSATAGGETYIDQAVGDHIVNTVTTTALEQTLKGLDRTKQWADIKAHTDWGELAESL